MANRRRIAAGNWKMNMTLVEGESLVHNLLDMLPEERGEVILCVPFVLVHRIVQLVGNTPRMMVAAQDCSAKVSGAYTGEVNAAQIASVGAKYVVIGHSERREYHNETNAILAEKVNRAFESGLTPIFCCGEPLKVREQEKHVAWVKKQIKQGIGHLTAEQALRLVVAYEPIWAIGTGLTASPAQAQETHAAIRKLLAGLWGKRIAGKIPILYGGSVGAGNAAELFSQEDVDGGLVGGASLKAGDFSTIAGALAI
jgi:triosephosphate isomerase (TIM)